MSNYGRGREAEYRTMRVLEGAGYRCLRMASSKGAFDVVGYSRSDVVFVQVKSGKRRPGSLERRELSEEPLPPGARALLHYWPPRSREPEVWEVGA